MSLVETIGELELPLPESVPESAAPCVQTRIPEPARIVRATLGLVGLGVAGGLGSGLWTTALRGGPSMLFVGMGTLLLTGPALVVVHQTLGLRARPIDVLGTLVVGFAAGGSLALGLAPLMLFFSATTALWLPVLVLSGIGCAIVALSRTGAALYDLERGERRSLAVDALVTGWMAISAAIGLRLAFVMIGGAS